MAYEARVYRILIASPSDVDEEREIAAAVIQNWNDVHSFSRKIVLLPMRWETHTAPELGMRPQAIINKTIVDECDLLIGIFWTRVGTPTGEAEGGTLEEIDRVGKANKPVMLYFSSVEIDPDKISSEQIEKLREFKKATYPNGLVETFRSREKFREKLSRQLEIKVKDLQALDADAPAPIQMSFLVPPSGEIIQAPIGLTCEKLIIEDLQAAPENDGDDLHKIVNSIVRVFSTVPIAMVVRNVSSLGIRNIYISLSFTADCDGIEISEEKPEIFGPSRWSLSSFNFFHTTLAERDISLSVPNYLDEFSNSLEQFDAEKITKVGKEWKFSFEWDALQPQREKRIEPVVYIRTKNDTKIKIKATLFADSFAEPMHLEHDVSITLEERRVKLDDIVPGWENKIKVSTHQTKRASLKKVKFKPESIDAQIYIPKVRERRGKDDSNSDDEK
jgi:hypothetical protein